MSASVTAAWSSAWSRMACSAVSSRSTSSSLSTSRSSFDLLPFLGGAGLALLRGSGMAPCSVPLDRGVQPSREEIELRSVLDCWLGQRILVGRRGGDRKTATAERRVVTEGRGASKFEMLPPTCRYRRLFYLWRVEGDEDEESGWPNSRLEAATRRAASLPTPECHRQCQSQTVTWGHLVGMGACT
jgi:hypothetical protein